MPPDEVMYVEICGGPLLVDQDSLDIEDGEPENEDFDND